ncbi:MAG: hypothetical protein ABJ349_00365, partial [Hyphomicrobiales bacterium]
VGGNYPLAPVPNDLSGVTQGRNNQLPAGSGYATTAAQGGNVGGNYPLAPVPNDLSGVIRADNGSAPAVPPRTYRLNSGSGS